MVRVRRGPGVAAPGLPGTLASPPPPGPVGVGGGPDGAQEAGGRGRPGRRRSRRRGERARELVRALWKPEESKAPPSPPAPCPPLVAQDLRRACGLMIKIHETLASPPQVRRVSETGARVYDGEGCHLW